MFFENIRLILIYPNRAWENFSKIDLSFARFFLQFVLPLIIVYGLCVFTGQSLSTLSTATISYVFLFAVFSTAIYLLAFYISTIILKALIPLFGGVNTGIYPALLIFYSAVPFYLSQMITGLFPSLIFMKLFSLYSFYLFYNGCEKLIEPDKDRRVAFYLVSVLTVIGVHLILYFALILPVFKLL